MKIEVSMDDQALVLINEDGEEIRSYRISSSARGMGSEEGSLRTPTGRLKIVEKIGGENPKFTQFIGRVPQGIWDGKAGEEDRVLTRILRLEGLEEGNRNSFARYIYIHGTNQEDRIGQPASHGCIRMLNDDIIDLFNLVEVETEVMIWPMSQPSTKLLFLDCDSTLSAIEGIDELARLSDPAVLAEVEALTNAAMDGRVPLDEVFPKRMEIIKPTAVMAGQVAEMYIDKLLPNAAEFVEEAMSRDWQVVILSGGFSPLIRPLAKKLGIEQVEAVPLKFHEDGSYQGYDQTYPTTRNHGKNEIIRAWQKATLASHSIMIGDGISDLETSSDVDLMIGFGGVVKRAAVKDGCQLWIESFDHPDLVRALNQ